MLFQIPGSKVVICGSIHFLPEGTVIADSYFEAVDAADECVFESDLDNQRLPDFISYPADQTFSQHLTPAQNEATRKLCAELGISDILPEHKLWRVTLRMSVQTIMRLGIQPGAGLDPILWEAAKRKGKSRYALEGLEALNAFDDSPLTEQIARHQQLLDDPQFPVKHFHRIQKAWTEKDLVELERVLQEQAAFTPVTSDNLVSKRDRAWLPLILGALDRGRSALFVIGSLHLVGLRSMLKVHGYDLVPIPSPLA